VGDSAAFSEQGGIITFVFEGDKLRFEINLESSERAGVRMSSQLLKLARILPRKS
jgi:hypothetical protein